MTKKRGFDYRFYNKTDYCPKCGLWGYHELWYSYLGFMIGSVKHIDSIYGYSFTVKRCWY